MCCVMRMQSACLEAMAHESQARANRPRYTSCVRGLQGWAGVLANTLSLCQARAGVPQASQKVYFVFLFDSSYSQTSFRNGQFYFISLRWNKSWGVF